MLRLKNKNKTDIIYCATKENLFSHFIVTNKSPNACCLPLVLRNLFLDSFISLTEIG